MVGQHNGAVGWSVALHGVLLTALTLSFRWSLTPQVAAVPAPIQGVIVDQTVLRKEQQRREQDTQRKQAEERQKKELVEQQQREKEAADKRERDRQITEQREREEKIAKQKAEQEAREKQAREDAARKQKEALEAKQRAQAEDDLRRDLAAENERREAVQAGVLDEYIAAIQHKIEQNWNQPPSAKPGLECVVNVVQLPTGDVYDAKVDASRCNGDEAVRRSIEAAVRKASPLPKPPSQAVFERSLVVTFKPQI